MSDEKQEKNRRIAEWLELLCKCEKDGFGWSIHGYGTAEGRCHKCAKVHDAPDFYADESANAMLLEAMPRVRLEHVGKHWVATADLCVTVSIHGDAESEDRKTVICEAFIKWKESQS